MERDLNSILNRINFKLNCYTQDNHFSQPNKNYKSEQPHKNGNDIYVKYQSNGSKHIQSQKQIGNVGLGAYSIKRNRKENYHLNEQQEGSGQKNKNKNQSYEQFRASRSHQRLDQPILDANMKNPKIQHHEQAINRLKSRNQTLESEVQILSAKLKEIEKSLEKGNKIENKNLQKEQKQDSKKLKASKHLSRPDKLMDSSPSKNILRKITNNSKIISWVPNGSNTNHKMSKNNVQASRSSDNLQTPKYQQNKQSKNAKTLQQRNLHKNKQGLSVQTSLDQIPLPQRLPKSCKSTQNGSKKIIGFMNKATQNYYQNNQKCKSNNKFRINSMQSLPEAHNKTLNLKEQKNKVLNLVQWNKKLSSSKGHQKILNLQKQNSFGNLKGNNESRKKVKKHSRVMLNQRKIH